MGKKEWLYRSGGGGGGGGKLISTAGNPKAPAGKSTRRGDTNIHSPPSSTSTCTSWGCMSAIFHFFDIQHQHQHQHHHHHPHPFQFQQTTSLDLSDHEITNPDDSCTVLKGGEAPRNSLELEDMETETENMMMQVASSSSSSSSQIKQLPPNLNIPMGGIQINTKRSTTTPPMDDLSSECSSSPSTKTPNLVARLMGLDLLPENSSPRPSSSSPRPSSSSNHSTPLNPLSKLSSRSLPATPRVSTSTSRRSTDTDYHHRLSLKENYNCTRQDQETSTSQYAKQIAKRIRENMNRRVGADITNTFPGRKQEQRRDENLVLLKPRRSPTGTAKQDDQPRLRLLEIKNNMTNKPNSPRNINSSSALSSSKSKPQVIMKKEVQVKNCNGRERYDLRVVKKMNRRRQEGGGGGGEALALVKKKCKEKKMKPTPLTKHLVDVSCPKTTTKILSLNKDMTSPSTPPTSTTKVSLESITQLPSSQSRSYNAKANHRHTETLALQDNHHPNPPVATTVADILKFSGIDLNTVISIAHWYSPSHPLHPSVLHKLLSDATATATATADHKLVFDVVDELLAEILKPYMNLRPWICNGVCSIGRICGSDLIGKLCESIGRFPAADCRVLEDIDALIDGDLRRSTLAVGLVAFEEEAEELVAEIERDMVDTLVHELASMTCRIRTGRERRFEGWKERI